MIYIYIGMLCIHPLKHVSFIIAHQHWPPGPDPAVAASTSSTVDNTQVGILTVQVLVSCHSECCNGGIQSSKMLTWSRLLAVSSHPAVIPNRTTMVMEGVDSERCIGDNCCSNLLTQFVSFLVHCMF